MRSKQTSLKQLLTEGQIFAPCVWDCFSAKAAEMSGFKALLLSGQLVSESMIGIPDLGMLNIEELIWATERVAGYSPLPVIVDADEGYGDSPINVFRNMERLMKAGATGFTLDDGQGLRGFARLVNRGEGKYPYNVFPSEIWLAKVKAALAAIEGTDCLLIARTECRPILGLEEAIDRCVRAEALGAPMTLINRMYNLNECKQMAAKVHGWKMYPDVIAHNGVPEVELEDIRRLGFNLVTMHYLEKGSMFGMLKYGNENFKNQNAVFSESHDMGGLTTEEQKRALALHPEKWLEMEEQFLSF